MINPSFTRGEYWLLETVVKHAMPISFIVRPDLEELLNKPGHGMSRSLLIETMHKLFNEGLIVAHEGGNWDDCHVLSLEQIRAALREKRRSKMHFYQLTQKGGEYWEAFARPQWRYFIYHSMEPSGDRNLWLAEIICADQDHLECYFKSLRFHDHDVVEDSIEWETIKPWHATYWKELPLGLRVRFSYREKENAGHADIPVPYRSFYYGDLWYSWN